MGRTTQCAQDSLLIRESFYIFKFQQHFSEKHKTLRNSLAFHFEIVYVVMHECQFFFFWQGEKNLARLYCLYKKCCVKINKVTIFSDLEHVAMFELFLKFSYRFVKQKRSDNDCQFFEDRLASDFEFLCLLKNVLYVTSNTIQALIKIFPIFKQFCVTSKKCKYLNTYSVCCLYRLFLCYK